MVKIMFKIIGILICGLVFDINQNGSFHNSKSYKYLKNLGVIDYAEIGLKETKNFLKKTSDWLEKNIPVYYYETSSLLKPYISLFCDLLLVLINNIINLSHNIIIFLNKNYPGFQDSVSVALADTISLVKTSLIIISDNLQKYIHSGVQYINYIFNNKNLES